MPDKQPPLCIEFIVDPDKGIYFGWDSTRKRINPYSVQILDLPGDSSAVLEWYTNGTLAQRVNEEVLRVFRESPPKGIPENCPYRLYRYGFSEACLEGVLKGRKD